MFIFVCIFFSNYVRIRVCIYIFILTCIYIYVKYKVTDERREFIGGGGGDAPVEDGDGDLDSGDVKRSTRPTTARRR
jgi:hypothetical protein